ncbi:unnamed protein product (macronuclear) [Paramecium tetraurelia]|uniref:Uncharacterized protein n=1 Tax=Paramecium tetraurelia TaxID=5888 RepID=A0DFM0_PARTE|nr:uncharacterized protein GSPATT00016650001 [Paramecium tetraurelia]CAK81837.1 unnamed protein product [Paramecium tetraurelia]|eukprot:XP_001449234.1 hypothetical protein (macronuclear) [Paramecium tetraurelia strain d4-2]
MGCHCTKTKEIKQSKQLKHPNLIKLKPILSDQNTQSPITTDQMIDDLEDMKPPKLCYISNTSIGGIGKQKQIHRVIGGKKEIFSYLYIRPYQPYQQK